MLDESIFPFQRLRVLDQLGGHGFDRRGEIDQAAGDGAVWHAGETGAGAVDRLGNGQAAAFLDRLDAEHAIGAAAREHDSDGIFAAILRQ